MTASDTATATGANPEKMKREFTFVSALGLGVVFVSPVVALYSVFALTILAGGGTAWWAFVIGLVGALFIALGFAEVASRWPFAGGLLSVVATAGRGLVRVVRELDVLMDSLHRRGGRVLHRRRLRADRARHEAIHSHRDVPRRHRHPGGLYSDQLRFAEGHQDLHRLERGCRGHRQHQHRHRPHGLLPPQSHLGAVRYLWRLLGLWPLHLERARRRSGVHRLDLRGF